MTSILATAQWGEKAGPAYAPEMPISQGLIQPAWANSLSEGPQCIRQGMKAIRQLLIIYIPPRFHYTWYTLQFYIHYTTYFCYALHSYI